MGVPHDARAAPPDRALDEALDALAQSEARFRTIVSLGSGWYWEQDAELRFVQTSARTDARGGIVAQAHLGKRRWELPGTEPVNTTWPEHQALLAERRPFHDLILRRVDARGEAHFIKVSGAPIFDRHLAFTGYRGIAEDITHEHRAVMELRESESRNRVLAEMVEQSSDAIIARDLDGCVTYWNAGAERLYGYSAAEAVGQPLGAQQLSSLSDAEIAAAAQRIRSGAREPFEAQRITKDGRCIDVAVHRAPLRDAQGMHVGELYVVRDITAAKGAQREMQRAVEAAEAANRAKGEFLASMSHEIRTPLNGILGMTRLVLDGVLEAEQRQLLSLVMASGNALATVINDVLDFSKIEAGKLDIEAIEFQPLDLLPDIVRTQALVAHAKGIELSCEAAPDVPPTLVGDPGRLRQVLLNLVGNALKFTERGEVKVTLDVESRAPGAVVLRVGVRDTGIGIAEHQVSRIFDAFAQGESGIARRYGGTGLGLTISARLVELMGGRIWVESEPGRGSRFYFTLRCGIPRRVPAPTPVPPLEQLRGLGVLVVEDNPTYREVLMRILASWGMRPDAAADGDAALALVRRARQQGRPYRVVLLDLILPGQDGFDVARALRRGAADDESLLIMITANGQRGDSAKCREIGISAYLSKPIRPAELFDGIVSALTTDRSTLLTRHSLRERRSSAAILLVEDNEVNRVLASAILERAGHHATLVDNGAEAVALCARQRFDLVLMDMQMPVLDGLQATAQIRAQEHPGRRVPIVALTANALHGDRDRCLAAGMDDYLAKPFSAEQLVAVVDAWLPWRTSGWSVSVPADVAPGVDPSAREAIALDPAVLDHLGSNGGADGAAFVRRVVEVFLSDSGQQLTELRRAVDEGDAKAVHRVAHTLKSSSAAVGAVRLSALCRSLEFGAAGGRFDAPLLLRIEQEAGRIDGALRAAHLSPG
jgi:two-component system, sensor histidine kinase and response regulator